MFTHPALDAANSSHDFRTVAVGGVGRVGTCRLVNCLVKPRESSEREVDEIMIGNAGGKLCLLDERSCLILSEFGTVPSGRGDQAFAPGGGDPALRAAPNIGRDGFRGGASKFDNGGVGAVEGRLNVLQTW
jgi:hypothetical protein